jgi:hypothetical protein
MQLVLPARPILARRLYGLAASIACHLTAVGVVMLLSLQLAGMRQEPLSSGPEVTYVSPGALTVPPPDQVLVEERDAGAAAGSAAEQADEGFDATVARIRSRKDTLFPFLTGELLFLARIDEQRRTTEQRLVIPYASPRRKPHATKPPLQLSQPAMQRLVDKAWSRRDRWRRFSEIARLAQTTDADEGRLPDLLRAYLDQNLLQPYHDSRTRDPRFWAMLGVVADHVDFIDFVRSYVRTHPFSKATTELLFLLDEFTQGSRDALLMLVSTRPEIHLEDTRAAHPEAFHLAVDVRQHYLEELEQRKLDSTATISEWYDQVRLRLLSTVVETTPDGYRSADARFLMGEILFNQNKMSEALRVWRGITPDPRDTYVMAYSEILGQLQSPNGGSGAEINRILGAEYRRWLDDSEARLRQFGYAFDRF